MKLQTFTTLLCGLLTASVATADDTISEGPFHSTSEVRILTVQSMVRRHMRYLSTLETVSGLLVLQYEPANCLQVDNSSYRFYRNFTERDHDFGFFLSDYAEAEVNPVSGYKGKAISLEYDLGSNVALFVLGAGDAEVAGFDDKNHAYVNHGYDDTTFVPGRVPAFNMYRRAFNFAICWQAYTDIYKPVLSWVLGGRPTNPTCEPVALIRADL
ncbi:hypothetical protein F4808DRAFT_476123 [Astrocystis sublimbata]|nr:hypothetical protein F4808DRAFT_476123 [Astrocystis sublimbata]